MVQEVFFQNHWFIWKIEQAFCLQIHKLQDQTEERLPSFYNTPERWGKLENYVRRFNSAILEVEYPSDNVEIMAMMEGLRLGPLFDSLSKSFPETLLEL